MEKETVKNRKSTEQALLRAVGEIIEENGFEKLGINAVAERAGVSKMLIYRYFESIDGLIASYLRQQDFWINFRRELPGKEKLGDFIKTLFREQIKALRENYVLRRIYRWELSGGHKAITEIRRQREETGIWLIQAIGRLVKHPEQEIAGIATLVSAAISYLVLLEENCACYNGIRLQEDTGWEQIGKGIDTLVDLWMTNLERA